jgi:enterochelin esterase-like enzyme
MTRRLLPILSLFPLLLLSSASTAQAQKPEAAQMLQMAQFPALPAMQKALEAYFSPAQLEKGEAFLTLGPDALFAIKAAKAPALFVDDQPAVPMQQAGPYFIGRAVLKIYTSHTFHYVIDGKTFGGRMDVPAFGPEAYEQAGVPQGQLSEKIVHTSKIYEGLVSDYWVFTPAQVNPAVAAPVMVWQDGQNYANRKAANRTLISIENLTHQQRIPAAIHVFIAPGKVGERAMRSIEYDTVTDKYARFVLEEILAEVAKTRKLRTDGYSRAIAGESSGAVCAFTAAWFKPDEFSRVYSRIGTYTSIQWKPGELDGGNIYPFALRKQPKRNIRIWLSDGSNDLENNHGSWPLQNIQMANSLKMREYDFFFHWGNGPHSTQQGHAELPLALPWLWRGYDAAKTSETYTMDPAEKDKPYFRVTSLNRAN